MNKQFYIVLMVNNGHSSSVIPAVIDTEGKEFPFKDTLDKMQKMFPGNHVTIVNWKRVSSKFAKDLVEENNRIGEFLI